MVFVALQFEFLDMLDLVRKFTALGVQTAAQVGDLAVLKPEFFLQDLQRAGGLTLPATVPARLRATRYPSSCKYSARSAASRSGGSKPTSSP